MSSPRLVIKLYKILPLHIFLTLITNVNSNRIARSVDAASVSQVRTSAMLLLLIVGSYELRRLVLLGWRNARTKFREVALTSSDV